VPFFQIIKLLQFLMRVKTKNFKAQRLLYHIRAKEKKRKKHTHTSFSVKLS